jgi:hypothetical protein
MSEESKNENGSISKEALKQLNDGSLQGSGFNGTNTRLGRIFREKLSKALPAKAIAKHPTKTYLSTIKAIYIIERLNDVFGIGGWDFEHEVVGIYDNNQGGKTKPYVVVRGRIYVREFDLYTPIQYGGHDIDDKGTEPADGFKSAVTDAITKCASFLEIGIQVFKGNPTSQEANKSKRKDEHGESNPDALSRKEADPRTPAPEPTTSGMPAHMEVPPVKKEEPVITEETKKEFLEKEEEDTESMMDALRRQHKELYGKYPNKNWSESVIQDRIEAYQEVEEEPVGETVPDPTPPPTASFEPIMEPEAEEVEAEEVTESAMKPNTAFDADADVDAAKGTPKEEAIKSISSYLDAASLKEAAGTIIFDAEMDGASGEVIQEIKAEVNKAYLALVEKEQ